jgi:hypothetical protein
MEPLTPAEFQELRAMIKDERLTDAEKGDLIRMLDNIVQSFILQARGLDGVNVSLAARANASFQEGARHGNLEKYDRIERVDLDHSAGCEGEIELHSLNTRPRRPEHP